MQRNTSQYLILLQFFFTECSCSIEMHRVISYRNTLTHQCHQCIWWVSGVGCSSKVDPEWERELAKIFVCQILFETWKSMHRMCCNVYIIVVVSSNWREEKRKQKKHQRQHETTFNTFDTIVSFALTWVWILSLVRFVLCSFETTLNVVVFLISLHFGYSTKNESLSISCSYVPRLVSTCIRMRLIRFDCEQFDSVLNIYCHLAGVIVLLEFNELKFLGTTFLAAAKTCRNGAKKLKGKC